ncbi:glutathione S-transferase Mu 1-like [Oppia nitens]|uniref:glutathione S-transferase Mu 1-like n=1 Tax=Oppia nitens TaxID=1686743 RepID=UPI0023DAAB6E|nr:glutathione S-transferase Mu 1-like [Oppia nitens]
MSSSKPILGYYKIRGLAQPIRLLLKYTGVDFQEKDYEFGPGEGFQHLDSIKQYWLKEKYTMGLDFPNLPYYLDGQHIKLTQSKAIVRYLARKHGLVGQTECELARQDMAEYQLTDYMTAFFRMLFDPSGLEAARQTYIADQLPKQLDELSKFLGTNQWLAGKQLTYVDFVTYECLDWFRLFSPETMAKFPVLVEYLTRFENLPPIKAYMSSPEFISWPICSPMVPQWGYRK